MKLNSKELLIVVQLALPAAHIGLVGKDQHNTECVRFAYLGKTYRFSEFNLMVEHIEGGMCRGDKYADDIETILRLGLVKAISERMI